MDAKFQKFLPVGLVKTPSQLTTGFVVRVDTYTCIMTLRDSLATPRQANSSLIIFMRGSDSKDDDPVISCELRPKVFFHTVGNMVLCAMDWKSLAKYSIQPMEIADKAFVQSRIREGTRLCVVAHCLGQAERKTYEVRVKEASYRTIEYEEELPDGCAGGAVLCEGQLVGVHVREPYLLPSHSHSALILHVLWLEGVRVGQGSGHEEMRRLVDAIRDGNVLTLRREVETHGVEAVRAMQADDGRDLVYMSAYYGSLPCLDYLLTALDERRCIGKAFKRGVRLGHAAAMRGHLHVLQHLSGRGYDLHAVDDDGESVAHAAVRGSHLDVLIWLSEVAPETLVKENKTGHMPAHMAASRGAVQVLSCLVYHCRIHVVGDKAMNSQGVEPLDCVEGGDHYRCRALLKKLHARRDHMYLQAGDFDDRLLPTFSDEFEARYQSGARPFSRGGPAA